MYGEAERASGSTDFLLRRFRYQIPPRTTAAIVKIPSVKPTASGTTFALLVEATSGVLVGNTVKLVATDAFCSRRILEDQ